jgi:hypothetical protein
MGKKKITNKFAAVKRMISPQDHRMYISPPIQQGEQGQRVGARSQEKVDLG